MTTFHGASFVRNGVEAYAQGISEFRFARSQALQGLLAMVPCRALKHIKQEIPRGFPCGEWNAKSIVPKTF